MGLKPIYPIYIPSKNRSHINITAKFLRADGVPFWLVVEPQERKVYEAKFGKGRVLVLPENDRGLSYSRNWIKDRSTAAGDDRHWQLDDNIEGVRRLYQGERIPCDSAIAFRVVEDFADRYENVAIAGLNYQMFAGEFTRAPFVLNAHVYSCTLLANSTPYRFRGRNEDVDMCLQVLAGGLCTVQVNVFVANKLRTMTIAGGQTDSDYLGDGRLKMARELERRWPGVVDTRRRYGRPQHVVRDNWRRFDTPLIPKKGLEIKPGPNEYGMDLNVSPDGVKSRKLRKLAEGFKGGAD